MNGSVITSRSPRFWLSIAFRFIHHAPSGVFNRAKKTGPRDGVPERRHNEDARSRPGRVKSNEHSHQNFHGTTML